MSDNITLPREVVERLIASWGRDTEGFYGSMDTLRAALAAPEPEPGFDGQLGHSVMLPRAPVPVLGLISDEARAALKAADAVESQEAYRTRAVAPDETEALRRDAERLRGLLAEAQKAVWMNYDGELLDRIEAALKEVPR